MPWKYDRILFFFFYIATQMCPKVHSFVCLQLGMVGQGHQNSYVYWGLQFQVNFSLFLFKESLPSSAFSIWHQMQRNLPAHASADFPCWILLMRGWPLTSQFWHLSLFHPLPKRRGLLLLEIQTLSKVRNNLLCPIQLSLRVHLGSYEYKASESSPSPVFSSWSVGPPLAAVTGGAVAISVLM